MSLKQRKAARRPHAATPRKSTLGRCTLLALPLTVAVGLLLLVFLTALLLATKDPGRYVGGIGPVALFLTALVGGMLCVRLYGRRSPLLCGLLMGICLVLLFTVPSFFSGNTLRAGSLFLRTLALPFAVLGSMLGAKQKRRRRHRR